MHGGSIFLSYIVNCILFWNEILSDYLVYPKKIRQLGLVVTEQITFKQNYQLTDNSSLLSIC